MVPQTVERLFNETFQQKSMKYALIGNGPMGHYVFDFDEEFKQKYLTDGTKVFFYKSLYVTGKPVLTAGSAYSDYLWVTREELKEYISDPAYYEFVRKILSP